MSAKITFEKPQDLLGKEGLKIGPTAWMDMSQTRINQFADATGDHQWIHVDVERAKSGPFGAPIAHGYLTLSLASKFLPEMIEVQNVALAVNYGVGKARFPSAVKAGARIRALGELIDGEEIKGGYQFTIRVTIEIENEDKPACVVDTVSRFYPV